MAVDFCVTALYSLMAECKTAGAVKLTMCLHLVPWVRIRGAIAPLPHVSMPWCSIKYRNLYLSENRLIQ